MEKEFKGTPGPWYAVNYGGWVNIQDEDRYGGTDILDEEKCELANINGQLIAAAPELLEALQNMLDRFDHSGNKHPLSVEACDKAKAAISKALNK